MSANPQRLQREVVTIEHMIKIFCTGKHAVVQKPCGDCRRLFEQVERAFDACPYKEAKPVCGMCPTNCFDAAVRQRLRLVMGYAGPRMLVHHPMLALHHCLDTLRSRP